MIRPRIHASFQPIQIPRDGIPPLLKLPLLPFPAFPLHVRLPKGLGRLPPGLRLMAQPEILEPLQNEQKSSPFPIRQAPESARSFLQHQRGLRFIVAFMAAKSSSMAASSTKKVFNRVFVQTPTYPGPSNSVVIRQHAPKSGRDYPSQPARPSSTNEGGTVLGASCPKSTEIHHPDNPDMRTLTGIILVRLEFSGPTPLREHAGYHRPRRSTVNPGLPRRSAAKTGDITMARPLQKIHLRSRPIYAPERKKSL